MKVSNVEIADSNLWFQRNTSFTCPNCLLLLIRFDS